MLYLIYCEVSFSIHYWKLTLAGEWKRNIQMTLMENIYQMVLCNDNRVSRAECLKEQVRQAYVTLPFPSLVELSNKDLFCLFVIPFIHFLRRKKVLTFEWMNVCLQ